ncbi:MAG: hypothetical protein ACE5E5_02275 [Phycisphaerae bacterium]
MKTVSFSGCLVLALVVSISGISCGSNMLGGGENPAGSPVGEVCPASRVTSIPDAGTVRVTMTTDTQFTGEQSGLGQAMGLSFFVADLPDQAPAGEILVAVEADGSLSDGGGRFIIADGCLAVASDSGGPLGPFFNLPTAEALSQGLLSTPVELRGSCAEGQIPIGPGGIGDTSGAHICIESEVTSCVSCDQAPGRWTQNARFTMSFRALDSIEGVPAFGPGLRQLNRVDIRAGDRVTLEFNMLLEYQSIP